MKLTRIFPMGKQLNYEEQYNLHPYTILPFGYLFNGSLNGTRDCLSQQYFRKIY